MISSYDFFLNLAFNSFTFHFVSSDTLSLAVSFLSDVGICKTIGSCDIKTNVGKCYTFATSIIKCKKLHMLMALVRDVPYSRLNPNRSRTHHSGDLLSCFFWERTGSSTEGPRSNSAELQFFTIFSFEKFRGGWKW